MTSSRTVGRRFGGLIAVALALTLLAGACGDDDSSADTDEIDNENSNSGSGVDDTDMVNACPESGCEIAITKVEPDGEELLITWSANFSPEVARNHIHVYWDNFEPAQVSGDAEARGVDQGEWVPTDEHPTYTSDGAVSVANRGESTTVCVTAADGEHAVLEEKLETCLDVSDMLPT